MKGTQSGGKRRTQFMKSRPGIYESAGSPWAKGKPKVTGQTGKNLERMDPLEPKFCQLHLTAAVAT